MIRNNCTTNSLAILLWNANGLLKHKHELEHLMHDKRIDVALISETHLTSRSFFKIYGYETYRTDHPDDTGHGGAAVLIKSALKQHPIPVGDAANNLQAATASICLPLFEISLAAVYCPPRFTVSSHQFENFFQSLGPRFLAGGDYNAKHPLWGSRLYNPKGRNLHEVVQNHRFQVHSPGTPTHWPSDPTRLPDIIDIFVSRGLNSLNFNITALADLSSDHSPVLLSLDTQPTLLEQPPSLTRGIMDWGHFKESINMNLNCNIPLKNPSDVEAAVEHFTHTIQNAAWSSSSSSSGSTKPLHLSNAPNYPLRIRELIQQKRRIRHRWQRNRLPEDRILFNRLSNVLKQELRSFKSENYHTYLESLSHNDGSLWSATKRMLKFKSVSHPLKTNDGSWAKSDVEKANVFSEHLKNVFQPHDDVINQAFSNHVEDYLSIPMPLSLPPPPFTEEEVKKGISRLPQKKSPGYDLITSDVLKQLPEIGNRFLMLLYNAILRTTHFPIQWKLSIIILILKPGKPPHRPESYRPISLLPITSKLFEKLLLPRLLAFYDEKNAIPHHQFGFRANHSTTQQLHRVVDYIADSLEKKQYCNGVFLDVSAAFDRVWHPGLLYKLKLILPDSYYGILRSFLQDRFFKVRQGQSLSDLQPINAGVPQGSILSPSLYSFYTSDLPLSHDTTVATYADDTAILSSADTPEEASVSLQNHIRTLEAWMQKWRIKVNPQKSTHVTFSLRRRTCPQLYLGGFPIPQSPTVRYLGLLFDRRLTWRDHIKNKRIQLNQRSKTLHRLICNRSPLSLRLKLLIYKVIIRPIWTYGIQLFGCAKKTNINSLQAFQSKILRTISGAPFYVSNSTLHTDLEIPSVREVAKSHYLRFHSRLTDHENPLVQQLSRINHPPNRRLNRSWSRDLLF